MRKLVLILIALIAVVTFIRAFDQTEKTSEQAQAALAPQVMAPVFEIKAVEAE
jgi:Tfp pilus assembly protein PilV